MQKLGKAGLLRGNSEEELEAGFGGLKFCNSREGAGLGKGSAACKNVT